MSLLARFRKDKSGNVAILFGLAIIPVLGVAGVALDYARASAARAELTNAIDSAALMAARDAPKLTDKEVRDRARAWVRANINSGDIGTLADEAITVQIDRTGRTVSVTAQASVPTSLTKLLGEETIAVGNQSQSGWGTNTVEVALVLDNTESMKSSSKMDELKKAATNFINQMEGAGGSPSNIRVAIVPFETQVRLSTEYKTEEWLRFAKNNGNNPSTLVKKNDWEGCVADRDEPYDTDDTAATDNATKYPAVKCATNVTKNSGLAPLQPLTDNWASLRTTITSMRPVGYTNVTIGVAWGLAALSHDAPLPQAAAANTPRLTKYMIVLTDGDNTENRFVTQDTPLPRGTSPASLIDPKTEKACAAAKTAGIQVYTIRVINGNANLLKGCATKPTMYYDVKDASGIGPVIDAIAKDISQIRLTM